jgi:hypothetical protein
MPPDVPDLMRHLVPLRWLLVGLVVGTAGAMARERRQVALLPALLFAVCACGFWVLMLGRPYGLFVDPQATRVAADGAVAAETGRTGEGFVAGERATPGLATWAATRLGRERVLLGPTWLPLLVLPVSAFLLYVIAGPEGAAAALLWLVFATGDLDSLRGAGFVPGIWRRPEAALAFVASLALLAVARRWIVARPVALAAAAVLAAAWVWLPLSPLRGGIDPFGALLLLTLDQGLWLVLALAGLRRPGSGAAWALVAAGGLVVLAAVFGLADVWGGHALFRAGLLLAAVGPLRDVAQAVGEWVQSVRAPGASSSAAATGAALLFAAFAAGSTLAWWDPLRWDPIARDSAEPLSTGILEPMEWIRRETPRGAVILASPEYAPSVAVLGGRRVLRAPTLLTPADDERRRRLERGVITGTAPPPRALLDRYGLRYVLAAPGDFRDQGLEAPHLLAERPYLQLRHVSAEGFRIYEIVGAR